MPGQFICPWQMKRTGGPRAAGRVGRLEKPAEMDGETLILN